MIGLSSALELQQAGHTSVTLLAKDFPITSGLVDSLSQINYTSPWGGAHNRWVPPPPSSTNASGEPDATATRDHALALATFHQMRALHQAHPEAGITFMKGVEYLEKPGPEYRALISQAGKGTARALGIEGFRLLPKEEFPDEKITLGFEYDTWCVNPMVYCAFLLNRFVYRGGKVVKKTVCDPKEVFEMGEALGLEEGRVDLVVNASGTGFCDEKSFITRGKRVYFLVSTGKFSVSLVRPLNHYPLNRPNLPHRQPHPRNDNPPKRRRHLDLLRAAQLRGGHHHRRNQGARQLGPEPVAQSARAVASKLHGNISTTWEIRRD